MTIYIKYL